MAPHAIREPRKRILAERPRANCLTRLDELVQPQNEADVPQPSLPVRLRIEEIAQARDYVRVVCEP